MKKATLAAILLAAIPLLHCAKEPIPPAKSGSFTTHFKYGQLLTVLEDPDAQSETYRDAARFYCFTESNHQLTLFSSLDLDTTFFEPLSMASQVLRWSIALYQGPEKHYQGDLVLKAWFPDTITRANFDFTFRLRFSH